MGHFEARLERFSSIVTRQVIKLNFIPPLLREWAPHLELDHLSLPLLVTAQLEMFAALDGKLSLHLAFGALQLQHQLLGSLGL